MAVAAYKVHSLGWALFGVAMALLFNPLIPVYGTREFWLPTDLAGGVAFICAAIFVRTKT